MLPAPDFSRVADIHRFDSYGRPHAAIDVRNVDFGHVTLTGDWRNCVFKGSIFAHATLGGAFHAPFLADATVNGLQDRLFNDKRIAGNA